MNTRNQILNKKPNNGKTDSLLSRIIWLVITTTVSSFIIFDSNVLISRILIIMTAVIFLLVTIHNGGKLRLQIGRFHLHVLAFGLYCLITSLWAMHAPNARNIGITILEILVCISVIYLHFQEDNTVERAINVIQWVGYIVTIYSFIFYGIDEIRAILEDSERLTNDFSNVNIIGMVAAISVIITVYKMLYKKPRLYMLLAVVCVVMIAATGSRKALVMMLAGAIWVIMARFSTNNILRNIGRYLLIAVVSGFILWTILQLPVFSGIMERMEGLFGFFTGKSSDASTTSRFRFVDIALGQFIKTPIFGVGINNTRIIIGYATGRFTYSHNNFAELLSGGGVIGFALYYSMYGYYIWNMFKYRKQADPLNKLCMIIAVILLVINWGYVEYYTKLTYYYHMVFFLHVRNLQRKENEQYVLETESKKVCQVLQEC